MSLSISRALERVKLYAERERRRYIFTSNYRWNVAWSLAADTCAYISMCMEDGIIAARERGALTAMGHLRRIDELSTTRAYCRSDDHLARDARAKQVLNFDLFVPLARTLSLCVHITLRSFNRVTRIFLFFYYYGFAINFGIFYEMQLQYYKIKKIHFQKNYIF